MVWHQILIFKTYVQTFAICVQAMACPGRQWLASWALPFKRWICWSSGPFRGVVPYACYIIFKGISALLCRLVLFYNKNRRGAALITCPVRTFPMTEQAGCRGRQPLHSTTRTRRVGSKSLPLGGSVAAQPPCLPLTREVAQIGIRRFVTEGVSYPPWDTPPASLSLSSPLREEAKKHLLHKKHEKMCIFIGKTPCNPGKRML